MKTARNRKVRAVRRSVAFGLLALGLAGSAFGLGEFLVALALEGLCAGNDDTARATSTVGAGRGRAQRAFAAATARAAITLIIAAR